MNIDCLTERIESMYVYFVFTQIKCKLLLFIAQELFNVCLAILNYDVDFL